MYSRRIAWTLTGTLLLGLTTYYNLQLQICFGNCLRLLIDLNVEFHQVLLLIAGNFLLKTDECLRLKEASHHLYCIETTKTTKRKV